MGQDAGRRIGKKTKERPKAELFQIETRQYRGPVMTRRIRTTHDSDTVSERRHRMWALLLTLTLLAVGELRTQAQFKLSRPMEGGISAKPVITNVVDGDSILVEWLGLTPPFQLQQKSAAAGGAWVNVGAAGNLTSLKVPKQGNMGIFRVVGGTPDYVGSETCAECHNAPPLKTHSGWMDTAHASAFSTLKKIGMHKNASCLPCHTVGFNGGGYVDEATTPHLQNVQCESCHGPAGAHVAWAQEGAAEPKILPLTTPSAMLCGGCHNGFHHPTYDEWKTAGHSEVIEAVANYFKNTNRVDAVARMNSCGACHSGSVRFEMLSAYTKNTGTARTNVMWPTGQDAAETTVTCVTCHDTHATHVYTNVITGTVYTNQLRYPLTSTNVFSYNTGTNFASQYNPNVSVCGQCHNARGASVNSNGRPPHHSVQYNILLGAIGVTSDAKPPQGAHQKNPLQCVGCHTHKHDAASPSEATPNYTGHGFRWTVEACTTCHTSPTGLLSATNLLASTQLEIQSLMTQTKQALDLWATSKNTNTWAKLYGALGWEYTSAGQISNPTGSSSIKGPADGTGGTVNMQAQIPQGIREARFNLYLIEHDGSKGVHNAPYARHLLSTALQKVNAELAKP